MLLISETALMISENNISLQSVSQETKSGLLGYKVPRFLFNNLYVLRIY